VVDAGAPAEVDAGAAPAPVPAPVPAPKSGPVTLTPALIMKVVRTQTGAVSRCFEANKDDLPGATGQLAVNFTIAGNGRVTAVKSQLPDKKVGRCVEGVVGGMKFPAHKDKEVTLTLPFAYQVNR
jgi:serine/threonine-protein kinase